AFQSMRDRWKGFVLQYLAAHLGYRAREIASALGAVSYDHKLVQIVRAFTHLDENGIVLVCLHPYIPQLTGRITDMRHGDIVTFARREAPEFEYPFFVGRHGDGFFTHRIEGIDIGAGQRLVFFGDYGARYPAGTILGP